MPQRPKHSGNRSRAFGSSDMAKCDRERVKNFLRHTRRIPRIVPLCFVTPCLLSLSTSSLPLISPPPPPFSLALSIALFSIPQTPAHLYRMGATVMIWENLSDSRHIFSLTHTLSSAVAFPALSGSIMTLHLSLVKRGMLALYSNEADAQSSVLH